VFADVIFDFRASVARQGRMPPRLLCSVSQYKHICNFGIDFTNIQGRVAQAETAPRAEVASNHLLRAEA